MEDKLVSYEVAKLAKEKGYHVITDGCRMYGNQAIPQTEPYNETRWNLYKDYYLAPTQSLLQKWLREEHNCHIELIWVGPYANKMEWVAAIDYFGKGWDKTITDTADYIGEGFLSYEGALEDGLKEALKLL